MLSRSVTARQSASPVDASWLLLPFSWTMLRLKSDGIGIQFVSLKKNGSASRMQPTDGLSTGPIGDRLYVAILSRISDRDRTPLPSPKDSQAREIGNWTNRVKNPPPTMKLRGA